jgi:putative oxidoreductase
MKRNLITTRNYGNDAALLLIRFAAGGLMLVNHGIGKVQKLSADEIKFMDFMGMGPEISLALVAFAEAVCAGLVMIGFVFRFALVPLIITMLVAAFVANAGEPFAEIESPLFYLLIYIALFITGPGKYSVDNSLQPGL